MDQTQDGIDAGLEQLERYRFSKCHVVLKRTARKGWKAKWDILRFPNFSTFFGEYPSEHFRNSLWFARWDGENYLEDQRADEDLRCLAQQVGVTWQNTKAQNRRQCCAPSRNTVISWDGKVTLCTRDVQLQNVIGEINHHSFLDIFEREQLQKYEKQATQQGVPQRDFCRDCGFPWSPNH